MTVDKVAGITGQENRGSLQILRISPARSGGFGDDELVKGMTAAVRLTLPQGSGLRSGNLARADPVALDVMLAVL